MTTVRKSGNIVLSVTCLWNLMMIHVMDMHVTLYLIAFSFTDLIKWLLRLLPLSGNLSTLYKFSELFVHTLFCLKCIAVIPCKHCMSRCHVQVLEYFPRFHSCAEHNMWHHSFPNFNTCGNINESVGKPPVSYLG